MLGHDHVAEDMEDVSLADLFEYLFEEVAGCGARQVRRPVVTTEREEVEIACLLVALEVRGHGWDEV